MLKTGVFLGVVQLVAASGDIVDLSLGKAGPNDFPEFNAAVSAVEAARESKAGSFGFEAALSNALASGKAAIDREIASHFTGMMSSSFLKTPSFRVSTATPQSDEGAAVAELQQLEGKRQALGDAFFAQARAELGELANIYATEFGRSLSKHSSFLSSRAVPVGGEGSQSQLNVRILGSNYSLAHDMQGVEARRDSAEDFYRAQVLDGQVRLLQGLQSYAKGALRGAAGHA